MALIYIGVGAVALAVGGGAVWGIFIMLEVLVKSMGVDIVQYILPAPIVLLLCYLLGGALYNHRKRR